VNLGWMSFLLAEKLNDNSLLIVHGKWQNIKCTCPSAQDERLLNERDKCTILSFDCLFNSS
jgi:hypothetical protein